MERCYCGDAECMHFDFDYPYCRSCGEHHRLPECPVDEQGRSLDPVSGEPWPDLDPSIDNVRAANDRLAEVARNSQAARARDPRGG